MQLFLFVMLRVEMLSRKSAAATAAIRKPGCYLIFYHGCFLPHIFQLTLLTYLL
jgi:hypothetical protein